MTNPCRRHFQRVSAALSAAAVPASESMEGATQYELHLAKMQQDYLRLKQVQSLEGKAELKRQLLPEYEPYVDGVLEGGKGAQDDVLTRLMTWNIDAGNYHRALTIGRYVLEHGLKLSDSFKRSPACLLAEQIAEAALAAQKTDKPFDVLVLIDAEQLTRDCDMPDQVRAKLLLALGRALAEEVPKEAPTEAQLDTLKTARANIARAIDLHAACGGKKNLEAVDRLLKKHADQTGS